MLWLVIASIIWGFSFGIIKNLAINLDPFVLNTFRVAFAALFFAPWFLTGSSTARNNTSSLSSSPSSPHVYLMKNLQAFTCGAIQIGLMYGPYSLAFRYIKAHEVALFTMTTPLIMSVLLILVSFAQNNVLQHATILRLITSTVLATLGGMIVAGNELASHEIAIGASLVQLSNLFFAVGLILWTRWFNRSEGEVLQLMTPFFLGALTSSLILCAFFATSIEIPAGTEWLSLIWLGVISSGLGFYLWNRGALNVNAATLSVANNIKLPIAIIISLTIFGEQANLLGLTMGVILITLALQLGTYQPRTKRPR
jgi:drug/metabolite transporter (DMT)-like permease